MLTSPSHTLLGARWRPRPRLKLCTEPLASRPRRGRDVELHTHVEAGLSPTSDLRSAAGARAWGGERGTGRGAEQGWRMLRRDEPPRRITARAKKAPATESGGGRERRRRRKGTQRNQTSRSPPRTWRPGKTATTRKGKLAGAAEEDAELSDDVAMPPGWVGKGRVLVWRYRSRVLGLF
ncbi:hypothetical protein NL676_012660 [Syzygium grande]|nr:hypothetical protein NL676_012660 [Syzygium grande]